MCLILFAYEAHADYPLVIAANRDEYYDRPSSPAQFWDDDSNLLGGRDLSAGGTWMAVSRRGRLAAVTNFRDGRYASASRSRGHLVSEFVAGNTQASDHVADLASSASHYGGFNLLLFDGFGMHYTSNRATVDPLVPPGVHGLSNHLLDTPWPKVNAGKTRLQDILRESPKNWTEAMFALLFDRSLAPDGGLPNTGVSIEWERSLSAAFIQSPSYGTRASTVLRWRRDGHVEFIERSFGPGGRLLEERAHVLDDVGSSARRMVR